MLYIGEFLVAALLTFFGLQALQPATVLLTSGELQVRFSLARAQRYPLDHVQRAFVDNTSLQLIYEYHSTLPMSLILPRKWFQPLVWWPMVHLIRTFVRARNPELDFRISREITDRPPVDDDTLRRFEHQPGTSAGEAPAD